MRERERERSKKDKSQEKLKELEPNIHKWEMGQNRPRQLV